MKKIFILFLFLSTVAYANAGDFQTIWSMDMNDTNFGFDVKNTALVANSTNTAVGTTSTTSNSGRGSANLDYSSIGGFEWGKTVLQVEGTLDFTGSGTASWFGLSFKNIANTNAANSDGYPFAWISADGIARISPYLSSNQVKSMEVTDKTNLIIGKTFSYKYTFDTTKDEKYLYGTVEFFDEGGAKIATKEALFDNYDLSEKSFGAISITYNGTSTNIIEGWLEDFSVSAYNIPEPATFAGIFGAIALALAVWRKRQ